MRRPGRDGDNVAFREAVNGAALYPRSTSLARCRHFGVDHFPAGDEIGFAVDDDEHVVRLIVHLGAALYTAVRDDDETLVLYDAAAFDKCRGDLVVMNVMNAVGET